MAPGDDRSSAGGGRAEGRKAKGRKNKGGGEAASAGAAGGSGKAKADGKAAGAGGKPAGGKQAAAGSRSSPSWKEDKKRNRRKNTPQRQRDGRRGGGGIQVVSPRRAKARFKEHWPRSEIDAELTGMGKGRETVLKGHIRINPRRRIEAYVTVEGVDVDVIVRSLSGQNRAVEGDLVAVQLLPVAEWDSLDGADEGEGERDREEATAAATSVEEEKEVVVEGNGGPGSDAGGDPPSVSEGEESESEGGEEAKEGEGLESLVSFVEKKLQIDDEGGGGSESGSGKGPAKRGPAPGGAGRGRLTFGEINAIAKEERKRPSGEVVGIVEPSHMREHVVCTLQDQEAEVTNPDRVVLRPVDERFPLLLLDKNATRGSQDSAALCEKLEKAKGRFILVKMTRWVAHNMRPFCQVVDVLGEMADMESQISAVLLQQGIQQTHCQDFSEEVLNCLPETPWSISEEEVAKRRDLREWRIFSIDPETARDLDDALSIEMVDESTARVGVHIADVTHFVRAATALDEEAANRATSVYMVDGVLPMLPRLLCEELCSLNPGTDRLAFSIVWDISVASCEIQSQWIGKSVIRSCAKLHYGQAQEIIEGKPLSSSPALHAFTLAQVAKDVELLDGLAKKLRTLRFESGALTLNIPRVSIVLGEDQKTPVGARQYVQRDSNYLVEEFMLLANKKVAEFIAERAPSAAVLRRHPPPHKRKIDHLHKVTDQMKIRMDTNSSSAIHNSLERIKRECEPHIFYALVLLTTKPMQNAMYFCTGATDYAERPGAWGHYALAFSRYTHFTSPIRRYADVMVHRLVSDVLAKEEKKSSSSGGGGKEKVKVFESTGTKRSPWGRKFTDRAVDQCGQCNRQKLAAKSVQDSSIKLYLALWLNREAHFTEAVIIDLNGPKWMGVFVPEFGMEFKLHWEDDKRVKAKWDGTAKQMNVFRISGSEEKRVEADPAGGDGEAKPKPSRKAKLKRKPILTLANFQSVKVSLSSAFKEKSCQYEIAAQLAIDEGEDSKIVG